MLTGPITLIISTYRVILKLGIVGGLQLSKPPLKSIWTNCILTFGFTDEVTRLQQFAGTLFIRITTYDELVLLRLLIIKLYFLTAIFNGDTDCPVRNCIILYYDQINVKVCRIRRRKKRKKVSCV